MAKAFTRNDGKTREWLRAGPPRPFLPVVHLTHLSCTRCGRLHEANVPHNVSSCCAKPLFARYDLAAAGRTLTREALRTRPKSLWRYREVLPVRREEDIVTLDHDLRRFQYTIVNNPIIKSHLGTVDVIPDGAKRCVVTYSTDLEPEVMALIIAGAAGAGLETLQRIFPSESGGA